MKVSVIIPTYNGGHKISGVLDALKDQSFKDFELIVVVDGSTDNTLEVLEKYKKVFSNLKIIYQKNSGRAIVRNKGAREANGDLLIFFDDDMLPTKNCIKLHLEHHKKKQGTILTGAQIDKSGDTDILKYKAHLSIKWSIPLQKVQGSPLGKENLFITAANFSILKKIFIKLKGFDEQLTDAEDFDMAVRALKAGIQLYYNHKAFAWHCDIINGASYIRRLRQYREAHLQLQSLKPDLFKGFLIHKPIQPLGIKKIGFLFFTNRFWINFLDGSMLQKLLPQFLRYKLYDFITTANGVFFPERIKL
tara:strand:+ start:1021 stop:1935 length:915 start_codon:yes stop_codon:yes gene_type:complete